MYKKVLDMVITISYIIVVTSINGGAEEYKGVVYPERGLLFSYLSIILEVIV